MRYDIELFEQLNEEYRDKPLLPKPVQRDPESARAKAQRQIDRLDREVPLADRVVLEVGCGHGRLTSLLPELGGASRAIGIDIRDYPTWKDHDDPRVSLLVGDLATETLVEDDSVDVVVSWSVLEHVNHPVEMLEAIGRALKPDGKAWLYFNLYRGPKASHRYNEVFFPWPHLIFENEVCEDFYRRNHDLNRGFAWVNGMTLAHYLVACRDLGLPVTFLRRHQTTIDMPFYCRFEEKLGRYPALDLETDFATIIIDKAADPGAAIITAEYGERQRAFVDELRELPA